MDSNTLTETTPVTKTRKPTLPAKNMNLLVYSHFLGNLLKEQNIIDDIAFNALLTSVHAIQDIHSKNLFFNDFFANFKTHKKSLTTFISAQQKALKSANKPIKDKKTRTSNKKNHNLADDLVSQLVLLASDSTLPTLPSDAPSLTTLKKTTKKTKKTTLPNDTPSLLSREPTVPSDAPSLSDNTSGSMTGCSCSKSWIGVSSSNSVIGVSFMIIWYSSNSVIGVSSMIVWSSSKSWIGVSSMIVWSSSNSVIGGSSMIGWYCWTSGSMITCSGTGDG
jgi:hypothetical protein